MLSKERSLEDIAADVCANELPDGELIRSRDSLLDAHFEELGGVSAQRLSEAMKSFHAAIRLLMPQKTVDHYVEEHLKTQPMPNVFGKGLIIKIVPGWAGDNDANKRNDDGTLNRKASLEKYTHDEALFCCDTAVACPDIPLALQYAQCLLGQYLSSLRAEIAKVDAAKAESLKVFQSHWADAANFTRAFMMGLTLELQNHDDTALDKIDQETVNRMFFFLESIDAFQMHIPAFSFLGTEVVTFTCPAHGFLKQFMTQGTFMRVVEKVRSFRRGEFSNPYEKLVYEKSRIAIYHMAVLTQSVVATGSKQAFRALNEGAK